MPEKDDIILQASSLEQLAAHVAGNYAHIDETRRIQSEHNARIRLVESEVKAQGVKWEKHEKAVQELVMLLDGVKGLGGLVSQHNNLSSKLEHLAEDIKSSLKQHQEEVRRDQAKKDASQDDEIEKLRVKVDRFIFWGSVVIGVIAALDRIVPILVGVLKTGVGP